jgi:hypothetical protein
VNLDTIVLTLDQGQHRATLGDPANGGLSVVHGSPWQAVINLAFRAMERGLSPRPSPANPGQP